VRGARNLDINHGVGVAILPFDCFLAGRGRPSKKALPRSQVAEDHRDVGRVNVSSHDLQILSCVECREYASGQSATLPGKSESGGLITAIVMCHREGSTERFTQNIPGERVSDRALRNRATSRNHQ